MSSRHRPLAILLTGALGLASLAPAAQAAKTKPASATTILKDCGKDGEISKRYRVADLKKARTAARKSKSSKYDGCDSAIRSAIAGWTGKKGSTSPSAVVRDCAAHDGLTRKYTRKTLKKAKKDLPTDAAEYGNCGQAINSQYVTVLK